MPAMIHLAFQIKEDIIQSPVVPRERARVFNLIEKSGTRIDLCTNMGTILEPINQFWNWWIVFIEFVKKSTIQVHPYVSFVAR